MVCFGVTLYFFGGCLGFMVDLLWFAVWVVVMVVVMVGFNMVAVNSDVCMVGVGCFVWSL